MCSVVGIGKITESLHMKIVFCCKISALRKSALRSDWTLLEHWKILQSGVFPSVFDDRNCFVFSYVPKLINYKYIQRKSRLSYF